MEQFLSIKQLAKVFGVSERHLYRQKAAGKLPPPIDVGGCNRWDFEEFRKHFENGKNGKPD
jgi:predicted DNA-binding transcriptional regulator AlpA